MNWLLEKQLINQIMQSEGWKCEKLLSAPHKLVTIQLEPRLQKKKESADLYIPSEIRSGYRKHYHYSKSCLFLTDSEMYPSTRKVLGIADVDLAFKPEDYLTFRPKFLEASVLIDSIKLMDMEKSTQKVLNVKRSKHKFTTYTKSNRNVIEASVNIREGEFCWKLFGGNSSQNSVWQLSNEIRSSDAIFALDNLIRLNHFITPINTIIRILEKKIKFTHIITDLPINYLSNLSVTIVKIPNASEIIPLKIPPNQVNRLDVISNLMPLESIIAQFQDQLEYPQIDSLIKEIPQDSNVLILTVSNRDLNYYLTSQIQQKLLANLSINLFLLPKEQDYQLRLGRP